MQTRNNAVLAWVKKKVEEEFSEDIHLLVVYGSYYMGNMSALSDVDFYFVPKTRRGLMLAQTFIIEGVGYDLFPLSWGQLERISNLEQPLTPLLLNSKIVYQLDEESGSVFHTLQHNTQKNLEDELFRHMQALSLLSAAYLYFEKLEDAKTLGEKRYFAGEILLRLSDAVAYQNGTYFIYGMKKHKEELSSLPTLPEDFLSYYDRIIFATDAVALTDSVQQLLATTSLFFGNPNLSGEAFPKEQAKEENAFVDFVFLAALYGEIISTFNKIYVACEEKNAILAFFSAISLQNVLNEEFPMLSISLLETFDGANLVGLYGAAKRAEASLVTYIENGGGEILRYPTLSDFFTAQEAKNLHI